MAVDLKTKRNRLKNGWRKVWYFFPVQLVLLHFKRNHLLMFFWLLLFMYVTGSLGSKYGVPYLFLAPEYLGEISFLSFFITGFAMGGFITAFNIYSYILHANEFRFLATLQRPFLKFCYNNFIIPFSFFLTYVICSYNFQIEQELYTNTRAIINIAAITLGGLIFAVITMVYFRLLNKNVFILSGKDEKYYDSLVKKAKESSLMKETKWYQRMSRKRKIRVETYIFSPTKIKFARDTAHYESKLLRQVFAQNHINASILEFILIISFFSLSIFREVPIVNIPAAASTFLLFTMFLFVFSALYSWFKGWTLTLIIGLFFLFNFFSNVNSNLNFKNYAYGLSYGTKQEYSWEKIKQTTENIDLQNNSYQNGIQILNNWKSKLAKETGVEKPKLILLNISGGGLRASKWTFETIAYLDSITDYQFFKQVKVITGASGGMIGANYYRELVRNHNLDEIQQAKNNIGKDLLNPLLFGIATTDFLFRYQTFQDGRYSYTKDRGYSFEKQLVNNLDGTFDDVRLIDYFESVYRADIPQMVFSPSVVNDGRRFLISSNPVDYLCKPSDTTFTSTYNSMENISFTSFFKENNPYNMKITSVMRANATFPYILPMVTLPTAPTIELMDAGVRDNYGIKTGIAYLETFHDWIAENTSGVMIVQIRDKQKYFEVQNPSSGSVISRLFAPIGSVYSNTLRNHDYNNDQLLFSLKKWFPTDVDVLTFYIDQKESEKVSMSWHLTQLDKRRIEKAIYSEDNQNSTSKIIELLMYNE